MSVASQCLNVFFITLQNDADAPFDLVVPVDDQFEPVCDETVFILTVLAHRLVVSQEEYQSTERY